MVDFHTDIGMSTPSCVKGPYGPLRLVRHVYVRRETHLLFQDFFRLLDNGPSSEQNGHGGTQARQPSTKPSKPASSGGGFQAKGSQESERSSVRETTVDSESTPTSLATGHQQVEPRASQTSFTTAPSQANPKASAASPVAASSQASKSEASHAPHDAVSPRQASPQAPHGTAAPATPKSASTHSSTASSASASSQPQKSKSKNKRKMKMTSVARYVDSLPAPGRSAFRGLRMGLHRISVVLP